MYHTTEELVDLGDTFPVASGAASPSCLYALYSIVRTQAPTYGSSKGLPADPGVGAFGASCRESHPCALDRVTLFLPTAGEEAFSVARVVYMDNVRLDVGNHPQLILPLWNIFQPRSGVTHVAVATRVCSMSSSWLRHPPTPAQR